MKLSIEDILFADSEFEKRIKKFLEKNQSLNESIECEKQISALFENDPEKRELLNRYKETLSLYGSEESVEYYKAGFRSGFWLALDVIIGEQF